MDPTSSCWRRSGEDVGPAAGDPGKRSRGLHTRPRLQGRSAAPILIGVSTRTPRWISPPASAAGTIRDAAQTVLHPTSRPAQSDRHDVTGLRVTPFKTSGDEARFVALGLCARVRRIGGALAGPHVVCDPGPRAWLSRISAKTTLDVERSKVVKTTLADSIQNLSIPRPFASFNVAEPTFA